MAGFTGDSNDVNDEKLSMWQPQRTSGAICKRDVINKQNQLLDDVLVFSAVKTCSLWSSVCDCAQNRGFSWLSKFDCPRIIGTRETVHHNLSQGPGSAWSGASVAFYLAPR